MSLILDALKRAESERREILAPLRKADSTGVARPHRLPWIVLGGVILVVAGTSAYFLGMRGAKPPTPTAAQAARKAPDPVAAQPKPPAVRPPSPVEPKAAKAPAVIPGTEGMMSLDETQSDNGATAAALANPAPARNATPKAPAATPKAAPAQAPATKNQSGTEDDAETDVDSGEANVADEAAQARPPPPPPALVQPARLKRFREMTPEYRADFPKIRIEVHVHDKDPARRWVMVNGRRYKEGQRLSEGPNLVEIVPEGLVVEYRGEKLVYPTIR